MKYLLLIPVVMIGMLRSGNSSDPSAATGKKILMSHYMPWYASKPISGHWGWHWTMNHYNPDKVDADGRRSIASHDYPLIGTYDSSDSDVLEC